MKLVALELRYTISVIMINNIEHSKFISFKIVIHLFSKSDVNDTRELNDKKILII